MGIGEEVGKLHKKCKGSACKVDIFPFLEFFLGQRGSCRLPACDVRDNTQHMTKSEDSVMMMLPSSSTPKGWSSYHLCHIPI